MRAIARQQNIVMFKRETGSEKGKPGVVPVFRSAITPVSPDQSFEK
jgi:hypothetical protein